MNKPLADPSNPGPVPAIEMLLSLDDVARCLNASRRTVERLVSAGKLPRPDLRLGRMPRWRPATIGRWVEGGGRA